MEKVFCSRVSRWILLLLMMVYTVAIFVKYGLCAGWLPWLEGIIPIALLYLIGLLADFATKDEQRLRGGKRMEKHSKEMKDWRKNDERETKKKAAQLQMCCPFSYCRGRFQTVNTLDQSRGKDEEMATKGNRRCLLARVYIKEVWAVDAAFLAIAVVTQKRGISHEKSEKMGFVICWISDD